MQFRSPGFIAITIVFLLVESLLAWALYGYSRHPGPFGYAESEPRLMHGKFVHEIGPGKSRYAPSQYLFVDVETGKLKNCMTSSLAPRCHLIGIKARSSASRSSTIKS